MKKIKILFLGDNLTNARQWKNAMLKYGNVDIIEWNLSQSNKFKRIISWILIVIIGKWYFKKHKADLVIGYRTTSYGFLAARTKIKPLVIALQGASDIWPSMGWLVPVKKYLRYYSCIKSDLIHAWGDHMKNNILQTGVNESKILVCPRGIDINLFNFKSFKEKISKIPIFITTRSLFPEYQFDLIISVFELLKKEGIDFRFNIIGEGNEMENIKNQIKIANLEDKVHLKGRLSNEIIPMLLSESHFYISLPITEGVSTSLFEAMACGCFPIVSDLEANRLFIKNNENGLLIKEFNPQNISLKIKDLLIDKTDWIESITLHNRKIVELKANLKNNITFFIENYTKLINSN